MSAFEKYKDIVSDAESTVQSVRRDRVSHRLILSQTNI